MNDLLSQEEIDALLKGDEDKDNNSLNESLTEQEIDALGEIGNISMGTAATTLFTLLNNKVTITTPKVTVTSLNEMAMQYPIPFVAVEILYTHGLEGNNLLIINQDDVKVITDLLMGGDGTNTEGELTELQLSAISEVMNQMIGSAATSLASMFSKEIGISPPNAFVIDFANQRPNHIFESNEPIAKINFKMEISGILNSYIMQLIPIKFAKDMVAMLMNGGAKPGIEDTAEESSSQPFPSEQFPQQDYRPEGKPPMGRQAQIEESGSIDVQPVHFQPLEEIPVQSRNHNIDLILDVPLQLSVELGRTRKLIQEILELNSGSIIELDKMAGEPVDILVNGKTIAKGEVVVIDDSFGVRITDIVTPSNRISHLR
ncbi:MAG: flagellar motor switch phosphatase FliY [Clostridiales bacterium]|nr:flagellar motor switch phosphatase FliY [Clostridiales bacterium]